MAVDGKPAITTPGQLVLRPVQAAIAAARQRIEKLEGAVTALQNAGGGNFDAVIQSMRQSIALLQTQVALLSGGIFDPQAANLVFAGPTSGSPDEPTFRSLVQDDLPNISDLSAQSGGLGGDELVAVQLSGVWYQTTVQDIANLAFFGSGGGGGGAVDSVNGQTGVVVLTASDVGAVESVNGFGGVVTIDAGDVGAVPGAEYVPSLASGVDGDELAVVFKGSSYYVVTLAQIAALAPGGGAVSSVNGQVGAVLLDAGDVGAVPGVDYVPALASGIDGDEILVGQKGSSYYSMTAQQVAALAGTYTAASVAPGSPRVGDRWVDLDTGILYTYFYDGNSYAWVEF